MEDEHQTTQGTNPSCASEVLATASAEQARPSTTTTAEPRELAPRAPDPLPAQPVPPMELVGRVARPTVAVVIPALNEADNLRHVLLRLPESVSEVILIDGGSSDDTIAVTRELCPTARILTQPGKGKGNALIVGFAAATSDIMVMLDADGSADPQEIDKFVGVLQTGVDFAKGTRFADGGGSDDITWLRRLGNAGFVTLANVLFRQRFTDLCYGLNAFWRHCLPYLELDCDGFEVEAVMNLRMAKSPLKIAEVGSFEFPRMNGASKLHTIRDGLRILWRIVTERVTGPVTPASEQVPGTVDFAPAESLSTPLEVPLPR